MVSAIIREYVRQECRHAENVFGESFFDQHLVVVADYASRLAARLGANAEVVELASYLHDISAVRGVQPVEDHPTLSAGFARRLLLEHGCSTLIAGAVEQAIVSHSSPLPIGGGTPEAVSLSNADALSRILRPAYWLYFAFVVRRLSFKEGREWLLRLIQTQWDALIDPARELAGARYQAALDLCAAGG